MAKTVNRKDQMMTKLGKQNRVVERKSLQLDPKNHINDENARKRKKGFC